jgi:hypothetical protein
MTSWLKTGPAKKKEEDVVKPFLFETDDAGLCSQFNAYLYAMTYSVAEKSPLLVNDTANVVSLRFPLIKNTFVNPDTVSFTDTNLLSSISLKRRRQALSSYILGLTPSHLREAGRNILQWNEEALQPTIDVSGIDIGVHIRTFGPNQAKNIPIEQYIKAVQAFQKSSKKTSLTVFVMSDSVQRFEEFKRLKNPSWRIVTAGTPPNLGAHSQRDFNAAPPRQRMAAYKEFLGELQVMQQLPQIICSFSSNVGKFLYLSSAANIFSVDQMPFSPF